jgi:chloramphenicol-sensitive protein RarD
MSQFLLGVLYFREQMSAERWAGFALVWLALSVLTWDVLRAARRGRSALRAAAAAAAEAAGTGPPEAAGKGPAAARPATAGTAVGARGAAAGPGATTATSRMAAAGPERAAVPAEPDAASGATPQGESSPV